VLQGQEGEERCLWQPMKHQRQQTDEKLDFKKHSRYKETRFKENLDLRKTLDLRECTLFSQY